MRDIPSPMMMPDPPSISVGRVRFADKPSQMDSDSRQRVAIGVENAVPFNLPLFPQVSFSLGYWVAWLM